MREPPAHAWQRIRRRVCAGLDGLEAAVPRLRRRGHLAPQPPGAALDGASRDGVTQRGGTHFPREVLLNAGPQRQAFPGNGISTAKYSLLSFAPRFLFQLFSRVAYLYFLVQAALTWWSAVSPFDPWGSTAALAFVVAVAAVSELWQDIRRHKADYEINNRTTRVMHANGSFRKVRLQRRWLAMTFPSQRRHGLRLSLGSDIHLPRVCAPHSWTPGSVAECARW